MSPELLAALLTFFAVMAGIGLLAAFLLKD